MKVVILAGGYGTRISEESTTKPKPMVEIGDKPILYHIMKIYSHYGYNEFIICCGYKGYLIKKYFVDYFLFSSDFTVDLEKNNISFLNRWAETWHVTLVDTGLNTMTGGRIRRVRELIGNSPFLLTYGDGLSDVNIDELVRFHKKEKGLVTLTAVQAPGRFGAISLKENENQVYSFHEKPKGNGAWINGGFFVVEPEAIDYIDGDQTSWEFEPLQRLAREGKLNAYRHYGFWHPMDTLRDKIVLEQMWNTGNAPWKIWQD